MVIFLLTFIFLFSVHSIKSQTINDIHLEGPGLRPDLVVLPARYFFVYTRGRNYSGDEPANLKDFKVEITGKSEEGRECRLWLNILDRKDGSFIARYKLYETCFDLRIGVKYKGMDVKGSPWIWKGPIYAEECYCPEKDINEWLTNFGCEKTQSQIEVDLAPFEKVAFSEFYDRAVKRFKDSHSTSVCHYAVKSNEVYRTCYGQHVGFSTFMDSILLSLARKVKLPDIEFFSNLGDWPLMKRDEKKPFPIFSWCGSTDTLDIVMPTYDITESSLEAMGRVSLDMLSVQGNTQKPWVDKEPKVFWRGRDASRERLKLIDIARKHPDLFNCSLTNFFFFRDQEHIYGPKEKHVSFFSFFNYKYLVNMDGTVAAYRLPYLLAGDSLVLKQDSPYYEHFYRDLEPGVHYVAFKRDLSDLVEQVKRSLANDELSRNIAKTAQAFARENLLPQNILCYHGILFNEWSKRLTEKVQVRKGMEHVTQKNSGCPCSKVVKDEL